DECAAGRHRPTEEERACGEEHADDGAPGERAHALVAGRLEVVDRPRAELDRERDGPLLRELVTVEAKLEAGRTARLEIAPSLRGVERAALEKDVGGLCERSGLREHLAECEVEVRVGVVEPGWHGVRAEPGRDAAGRTDGAKRSELRVTIE